MVSSARCEIRRKSRLADSAAPLQGYAPRFRSLTSARGVRCVAATWRLKKMRVHRSGPARCVGDLDTGVAVVRCKEDREVQRSPHCWATESLSESPPLKGSCVMGFPKAKSPFPAGPDQTKGEHRRGKNRAGPTDSQKRCNDYLGHMPFCPTRKHRQKWPCAPNRRVPY
jgi:hypothetical protein